MVSVHIVDRKHSFCRMTKLVATAMQSWLLQLYQAGCYGYAKLVAIRLYQVGCYGYAKLVSTATAVQIWLLRLNQVGCYGYAKLVATAMPSWLLRLYQVRCYGYAQLELRLYQVGATALPSWNYGYTNLELRLCQVCNHQLLQDHCS